MGASTPRIIYNLAIWRRLNANLYQIYRKRCASHTRIRQRKIAENIHEGVCSISAYPVAHTPVGISAVASFIDDAHESLGYRVDMKTGTTQTQQTLILNTHTLIHPFTHLCVCVYNLGWLS